MDALLERTTKSDQKVAQVSMSGMIKVSSEISKSKSKSVDIQIQGTGVVVKIPYKAFSLLMDILVNMSEGKSITIVHLESEVSTQEAADLLKVSRPHLVKLLESNRIPFKRVGSHRRILISDLLAYENELKNVREENLRLLAEQAQELNLGY